MIQTLFGNDEGFGDFLSLFGSVVFNTREKVYQISS